MTQQFVRSRDVYVDRDALGTARQLLHTHSPVPNPAATPQLAATSYLHQYGELLGLTPDQLKNLSSPPSEKIEEAPVEYRFLTEKRQFD